MPTLAAGNLSTLRAGSETVERVLTNKKGNLKKDYASLKGVAKAKCRIARLSEEMFIQKLTLFADLCPSKSESHESKISYLAKCTSK